MDMGIVSLFVIGFLFVLGSGSCIMSLFVDFDPIVYSPPAKPHPVSTEQEMEAEYDIFLGDSNIV